MMFAALVTWLLPVPEAVAGDGQSRRLAFACLLSAGLVATAGLLARASPPSMWRRASAALAVGGGVVGIAAFLTAARVEQVCTARHAGRPVVIGTEWTPVGRDYREKYPELSVDELLADSAGRADVIWTKASIDRCRLGVSASYFLWVPMLTVAIVGAVGSLRRPGLQASGFRTASAPPDASATIHSGTGALVRYDAFISYRHGEPDARVANALLDGLEAEGYAVAFDARDFMANERFLGEMERCVRESRFTLALVSRRYLESGNCEEEAMICKVLDMGERRRRLVPIYLEDVEVPIWLHGIVGIRLDADQTRVDPIEKLSQLLGPPLSRER